MDNAEMLKQLGLSPDDFNNLLLKFRVFYGSLTDSELKVVNRLLPTFSQAAALFGGKIDRDQLRRLLAPPPPPSPPPPHRPSSLIVRTHHQTPKIQILNFRLKNRPARHVASTLAPIENEGGGGGSVGQKAVPTDEIEKLSRL